MALLVGHRMWRKMEMTPASFCAAGLYRDHQHSFMEDEMPFDTASAASYADSHAGPASTNNCASYVRRAIEWGGVSIARTSYAKDYGSNLESAGFVQVTGEPKKGDVVVIQPAPGHPDGHMAIFDGSIWISDFRQTHAGPDGFYPGPDYRKAKPSYTVYRYN